jgi:beta-glucosidase
MAFKGLVMTDWGALHSTVKGAKAGLDLEMDQEGHLIILFC